MSVFLASRWDSQPRTFRAPQIIGRIDHILVTIYVDRRDTLKQSRPLGVDSKVSHRSKLGNQRLALVIDGTKRLLGVPEDYLGGRP